MMTKKYLAHYGIKGQRWGIRRFQNEDGSLTPAGRRKYNVNDDGTVNLKDGYRKSQNNIGLAKTAIGVSVAAGGVRGIIRNVNKARKVIGYSGRSTGELIPIQKGQTLVSRMFRDLAIASVAVGTVVVASGVKNFVEANKNRTFNSTGMSGTPENFTGKPKTRAQVLAKINKQKQNT